MVTPVENVSAEPTALTQQGYQMAVHEALALIESATDRWLDEDTIDIDCARSGGMLTLTLPNQSQIIVNAQPPLRELWLAAQSGGYHFSWQGGQTWADTKTATSFWQLLSSCLSAQAGMALAL